MKAIYDYYSIWFIEIVCVLKINLALLFILENTIENFKKSLRSQILLIQYSVPESEDFDFYETLEIWVTNR